MPTLKDRRIAFLESHRRSPYTTFNASYALLRLDHLNHVLKNELPLERQIDIDDELFFLRPYYLVGICTCFEWHARSRCRDFVEYFPDRLDVADKFLPKDLSVKVIIDGIKQGSTIGELFAASIRINSVEEYLGAMEFNFGLAGLGKEFSAVFNRWKDSRASELKDFFEIFVWRHSIVHEMPLALFENRRIGPLIYIEDVRSFAKHSYDLMEVVEKLILEKLPLDFPDRLSWLDKQKVRVDFPDLISEIDSLEKVIAKGVEPDDVARFNAICAAWRSFYTQEDIDNGAYIPHYRDGTDREFFKRQICADRIKYLRRIIKDYGYSGGGS